jgi:hypothetical protein
MFLPVIIPLFIVFLLFLKRLLTFFSSKGYVNVIVYAFCGFLVATSIFNNHAISLYRNGHVYTSSFWLNSETIENLKEIPLQQKPIYTNEPHAIYLFLGINPHKMPIKYNLHTEKENPTYQKELDNIMGEIKEKDGFIVFFDYGLWIFPHESEELINDYNLYLIKDTSDGAIYQIKD